MSTINCDDHHQYHHHKNYHPHQLLSPKKPFKDLEIPPRKLFTLSKKPHNYNLDNSPDNSLYDSNLHKYLPYNKKEDGDNDNDDDEDDLDPYSSDNFRMFEFKIRRCMRSRSHDWTDCPFAHPGEKARRRDPRKFHYSGAGCPEFRRAGGCSRGDNCEFAHGVFECWLHPSRYRTEACKDGKNCKRKVCFFAHTPNQLRVLPEISSKSSENTSAWNYLSLVSPSNATTTCSCTCMSHYHQSLTSPTSTLLGINHMTSPPLSPSLSPPISPDKHRNLRGFSNVSRNGDGFSKFMSYKDVVNELMSSIEAMGFNDHNCFDGEENHNYSNCEQQLQEQFVMSPSTPSPYYKRSSGDFYNEDCSLINGFVDEKVNLNSYDPDLGWVNELLM